MILYTVIPQELIFHHDPTEFTKRKMVHLNGIPLLVEMTEDHAFQIIQVMSTDPSHYLDQRYEPGAKIYL